MMMKLMRLHLFASDPPMRRATHNSALHNEHRDHSKLSDSLLEEYWELNKQLTSPYIVEATIKQAYLRRARIQCSKGFGIPFCVLGKWAKPGLPSFVAWRLRLAFLVDCEMNCENRTLVSPFFLPVSCQKQNVGQVIFRFSLPGAKVGENVQF